MYICRSRSSLRKPLCSAKEFLSSKFFYSQGVVSKMRLQYVPNPPNFTDEEDKAIVERIKERRGERGLIGLDRSLLHAPPVADGW